MGSRCEFDKVFVVYHRLAVPDKYHRVSPVCSGGFFYLTRVCGFYDKWEGTTKITKKNSFGKLVWKEKNN